MRKIIRVVFLISFVAFPILVTAEEGPVNLFTDGDQFSTGHALTLTVLVDGKRSRDMVVSYAVSNLHGKWEVTWDAVNIMVTDGALVLYATHYSTMEGSIRNLKVGRTTASFDIAFSGFSRGEEMPIVVPKNGNDLSFPEIRASRVYSGFFEKLFDVKVTHKEEWEPTDKIILPSNEVLSLQSLLESIKKK